MSYGALFAGARAAAEDVEGGGNGGGGDGGVEIRRRAPPAIAVPVFQRTYCWSDEQVRGWWSDAALREGRTKGSGSHASGRCLFRRVRGDYDGDDDGDDDDEGASTLLCLDGQQRCTTTQLALAALRDAAATLPGSDPAAREVADCVDAALYRDANAAREWIASAAAAAAAAATVDVPSSPAPSPFPTLAEGSKPPFATTLLPSFVDRAAFF